MSDRDERLDDLRTKSDAAYTQLTEARAEIARLKEELAHEERAHLQTIEERDSYHDAADDLSYAIADPDELGEHSNMNDPWKNAIEFVVELRERAGRAERAEAEAAELRKDKERNREMFQEEIARLMEALNDCLDAMSLRQETNAEAYDQAVLKSRAAIDSAMVRKPCEAAGENSVGKSASSQNPK